MQITIVGERGGGGSWTLKSISISIAFFSILEKNSLWRIIRLPPTPLHSYNHRYAPSSQYVLILLQAFSHIDVLG